MTPSPLVAAACATALLAVAAWCSVRAVRPRARTVSEVRAILHRDIHTPVGRGRRGTDHSNQPTRPFIDPLADPFIDAVTRIVDRRLATGLSLAGTTAPEVAARVTTAVVVASVLTVLLVCTGLLLGFLPGGPAGFVIVPLMAVAAAWSVWTGTRRRVDAAAREFRRTTNDVIQLVAVGLTTDQSVESALEFAVGVGDSPMFRLLRDELAAAPLRGVSLWDAIDEIGRRSGQHELCELATAIERQGTQGVSISETVATLSRSMRERALADLERDADRANANLAGPTVAFVCTTIVFLAYPLAVRVSEAFGGT